MSHEYEYRDDGAAVNCFPINNDKTLWIENNHVGSIKNLLQKAKEKWPDVELEDINIELIHHHQYCIYYDLHDAGDYVDYIVLSID